MIECPSCGRQHRPGTLFCSECGAFLVEQQVKGRTTILPFSEFVAHAAPPPISDADLEIVAEPRKITEKRIPGKDTTSRLQASS